MSTTAADGPPSAPPARRRGRPAPPPAEATRSLALTASSCLLAVDAGEGLAGPRPISIWTPDSVGDLLLAVPDDDPLARLVDLSGGIPARLELVDVAPAVLRDRIRGRLVLTGWVTNHADPYAAWSAAVADRHDPGCRHAHDAPERSAVLHLEVVEVEWDGGEVDVDDYRAARPDPLADREVEILLHLVSGHAAELADLRRLIPGPLAEGAARVVPLRLHRRALVLRVEHGPDDIDVLLPLTPGADGEPLTDPAEILHALRHLVTRCPQADGCGPTPDAGSTPPASALRADRSPATRPDDQVT